MVGIRFKERRRARHRADRLRPAIRRLCAKCYTDTSLSPHDRTDVHDAASAWPCYRCELCGRSRAMRACIDSSATRNAALTLEERAQPDRSAESMASQFLVEQQTITPNSI